MSRLDSRLVQRVRVVQHWNPNIVAAGDQYTLRRMRDSAIDEWVEEITNFAILSHTWEADELNYEDFHQESGSGNQDDKKLAKFCHIVYEDYGAEFAWADNLC